MAAESHEVKGNKPYSVSIHDEWIVLFRNSSGQVAALQDRCLHRSSRLSKGHLKNGELTCPYHGWKYNFEGKVIHVPSEGTTTRNRCAKTYQVIEKDNYIYLQLSPSQFDLKPFSMSCYQKKNYTTIRLQNIFENTVTNCAENFLDIPHTTFVHPSIFRNSKNEEMCAVIERKKGHVKVTYLGEKSDFGLFSWFLNPHKKEIIHTDEFFMPNVTMVNYWFGNKHFIITSQSVPIDHKTTKVYTDLTYNYGFWNLIVKPVIRWQGQAIIDQDIEILKNQSETIQKYGAHFQNSPADLIHTFIESIQHEIEQGRDPNLLPEKEGKINFWV